MSVKGQGHYLTLAKGHSDLKIKTCFVLFFLSETVESFKTNFHIRAYG